MLRVEELYKKIVGVWEDSIPSNPKSGLKERPLFENDVQIYE